MGLPFVIVEGTVLVVDDQGNLGEIIPKTAPNPVGEKKNRIATQSVLQGSNAPYYECEVDLVDGRKRILTDSIVRVEQIFGFDDFADTWFGVPVAGAIGDTVRVQIVEGPHDTTNPDRDAPAVDLTYTLIAEDVGDELQLRDNIISALNADSNFSPHWKASSIKDNAIIHITSKYMGEFGERPTVDDFQVTSTGTTEVFRYHDVIIRRGKQNTGARDPRDKRLVTVGVSGEVTTVPGEVGDLYIENATYNSSPDLRVDGSVTPVIFSIPLSTEKDVFIRELRFYGGGAGIRFGQFLSKNQPLSVGVEVNIKSDDQTLILPPIQTTEDFKNKFSFGSGANFRIDVQAGSDQILAVLFFETPFPLRKIGTFTTDDYVQVHIHDNLLAGLSEFEFMAVGFEREP